MSNSDPKLGDRVKCKITGFTGIVCTYASHLAGCDRLWVEPPIGEDGKRRDGSWFDIDMVDVVDRSVVQKVAYNRAKPPGGFDQPPSR